MTYRSELAAPRVAVLRTRTFVFRSKLRNLEFRKKLVNGLFATQERSLPMSTTASGSNNAVMPAPSPALTLAANSRSES